MDTRLKDGFLVLSSYTNNKLYHNEWPFGATPMVIPNLTPQVKTSILVEERD